MPKIYDCFPFFNELDLLEIRLNYLDSVVDYFVLCESEITFSGLPKKLFYQENKDLFKKFEHKIIHVVVDDTPAEYIKFDPFRTDQHQRNSVAKGLNNCNDDDIIITSDLDEFPNIEIIKDLNSFYREDVLFHLAQDMYYYYFNLKETSGKLLSHSGEFDGIIECAAHQEFNNDFYKLNVQNKIDSNEDVFFRDSMFEVVSIDDGFPRYIVENKQKFGHLIKEV